MIHKSELEPLSYDDIILLPNYSEIDSRDKVNLYLKDKTYMPIFSAPMKNISEPNFIIELDKLGGVGILHRFFEKDEDRYNAVDQISCCKNFGVSIGINDWKNELRFVEYSIRKGCSFICIDTAYGNNENTIDAVEKLSEFRKNFVGFYIIAGNVIDDLGCLGLIEAGANIIRVNIGSGLQCLTTRSIGIGCPTLTAIKSCSNIKQKYPNVMLLADGGIYNSGQMLKLMAFGGNGSMIGSLFGRAKECENKGLIFGMSSFMLQERMNKTKKSNEGTVTIIPKEEIRPLKEIFDEFTYGLKSGLSYLGCDDINNIHDIDIEYIKIR